MTAVPAAAERTVGDALRFGRDLLHPSPSAALDAQLLLGQVLRASRAHVLAHDVDALSRDQFDRYAALIERRRRAEPLAYLRGWVEWYGTEYVITPEVLIPRPETELLLERVLAVARARDARTFVDVGTGSGAIASQLAIRLPDAEVLGIDVSQGALQVASVNVRALGVADRVTLLQGNLLDPVPAAPDLIVANLPYLSRDMMASLDPDVRHEPVAALYGGPSGLELYAALFGQVRDRGWQCPILVEIDPRQTGGIRALVEAVFPGESVVIEPDYAGHDRVVAIGIDG